MGLKLDVTLCFLCVFFTLSTEKIIKKRQIFREQVLPEKGGKVPESAFWTDRLALNQLNAVGIYSTNGVHLEYRQHRSHHNALKSTTTMQVKAPSEDRFVAPPGRHNSESPTMLSTTYRLPDHVSVPLKKSKSLPVYNPYPLIPYTSLKLTRYYKQRKHHKNNNDSPRNEVESVENNNDFSQVKNEYQQYLQKLHEVD